MVEPYKMQFSNDPSGVDINKSDGREGYLGLVEVLDQVRNQSGSLRLGYNDYMSGLTMFVFELGKFGEKSGNAGALDIEVHAPWLCDVMPTKQILLITARVCW